MNEQYKIAVIGLGSIGRRHIKNIEEVLKERKISFAIDLIRSGEGKCEISNININEIYYLNDIVPDNYDVIFITNPTYLHFNTIKSFINNTKHMFIEKPVFDSINVDINELNLKSKSQYYVACPLRYTNVIQYLRTQCDLNNVYCVRIICSSYLPDWRPGQDYRNTYSAHKSQGGGVSVDLIHEWDYLCYLFGEPEKVINVNGKFSNLEIDSEDLSLYFATYRNMVAEVHLDYFGRKAMREIQLFSANDTIVGDLINNEIRYLHSGNIISLKENRDKYQKKEIEHFFDIIEGSAINDNDITRAFKTLKIVKGVDNI